MSLDHNRIKVADLEKNLPNKVLTTNSNGVMEFGDMYNALDCAVAGKVLDARQGKELKDLIDNINVLLTSNNLNLDTVQKLVDAIETLQVSLNTILVNDLTTGGVTKALTAEMGKMLKALIDYQTTVLNNHLADVNAHNELFINKVDKVAAKSLLSDAEIARLATLSNYTHPVNHPPSIIVQDTNNRFVTDAEKVSWNTKQSTLGFTPENSVNKNAANGYAGLGSDGKLIASQLPSITISNTFVIASQAAMLALAVETGDIAIRTDLNKSFILKGTNASLLNDWQELLSPTDSVTNVFGRNGSVTAQTGDYTAAQITETAARKFQTANQQAFNDATSSIQTQLNSKQAAGSYEPAFTKNTGFNKNFGTVVNTVSEGNDPRILNGQTAFGWGNHVGLYPTLSGAGATGTWNVNISGLAALSTNLVGATNRIPYQTGTNTTGTISTFTFDGTTFRSPALVTTSDILSNGLIVSNSSLSRDKIRLANNPAYSIGYDDLYTFGGITNSAMTFQLNADGRKGFWWGTDGHSDAQGAMALTVGGRLTVAHSLRLGYGESDTTAPGSVYRLDVSGNTNVIGNTLVSGSVTANNFVGNGMLSGYGIKDAQYKTIYNFGNGCLVEFDFTNNNAMCHFEIKGNGYSSLKSILIQGHFYSQPNTFTNYSISKISGDVEGLNLFIYNGKTYLWFKQILPSQTFSIFAWAGNNGITSNLNNRILNITNAFKPTDIINETLPTITTLISDDLSSSKIKVQAASTTDIGASIATTQTLTGYSPTSTLDVTTVLGSTTVTSTSIASIKVGAVISGNVNITDGTTVLSIINATTFELSVPALSDGSLISTLFTQTISTLVIDGISINALRRRVLLKDQTTIGSISTTAKDNGIYELTQIGSSSIPWVLTRANDANTNLKISGTSVSVDNGSLNGGKSFQTNFKTTGNVVGTHPMNWYQVVDTSNTVSYSPSTRTAGSFYGGSVTPLSSTRLNYDGYFYPTQLNLLGTTDTTTTSTHYMIETASDGFIRPKTLANVRTEIVTTSAVDSAKPNILTGTGTINYLPKYNGIGTQTNSSITDNGAIVSVLTNTVINGNISAIGGNSSQWNTSYGWGDHSLQNYFKNSAIKARAISVAGGYDANNTEGSVSGDFVSSRATGGWVTNGASGITFGTVITFAGANFGLNAFNGFQLQTNDSTGEMATRVYSSSNGTPNFKPWRFLSFRDEVVKYNGTTSSAGLFDGGTSVGNFSNRLNYSGHFYPNYINLSSSVDTSITASHYFVETGNDGFVRPKILADVRSEIVTTAAVDAAKPNIALSTDTVNLTGDQNIAGRKTFYDKTNVQDLQINGNLSWIAGGYPYTLLPPDTGGGFSRVVHLPSFSGFEATLATDENTLHKSGDESFTGVKSVTNTGTTQINGLALTNNGTGASSYSLGVTNTDEGTGIMVNNTGIVGRGIQINNSGNTTRGLYVNNTANNGFGIWVNNTGNGAQGVRTYNSTSSGSGIYSENTSTSVGITSTNASTGIGIRSSNTGGGISIYSLTTTTGDGIVSDAWPNTSGKVYIGKNNGTITFSVDKMGTIVTNGTITSSAASVDTELATLGQVKLIRPYKVYTALMTQSGTSDPTVTILENTLGGTIAWTRSLAGTYHGTLAGVFTSGKTSVIVSGGFNSSVYLGCSRGDNNWVLLTAMNSDGTAVDNGIQPDTTIEIRVYN